MPVKIAIQCCRVDTDQNFEYLGDISIGDVNSDKLNLHSINSVLTGTNVKTQYRCQLESEA